MKRWVRWVRALLALTLLVCAAPRPAARPVSGGGAGRKMAALTFDDGPGGETTARLLDGLRARGVHATFFLIGRQAEEQEELVRRMAREGHQIGIHTYDHVCLRGLDAAGILAQTEPARRAILRAVGERELWLRPPYGLIDEGTPSRVDGPLILWSLDPEDWRDRDTARICREIVSRARDGDVILLHDIYESSVDAALMAADALLAEGFELVTVERLLAGRGIVPGPGQIVRSAPAA